LYAVSFVIAKAMRQDAFNPNVPSETNFDIGRVLKHKIECNWSAKKCCCHVHMWVKRAYKFDGFIKPLPGYLEKKIH